MDDAAKLVALQQEFSAFMESSKELEFELQEELGHTESKLDEVTKKKSLAEDKVNALQIQLQEAWKGRDVTQAELTLTKTRCAALEVRVTALESDNDALQEKTRILEATEADLTARTETAQESLIFAQV